MFKISKEFDLDTAHHVYNQSLDKEMTETDKPVRKCLRPHGHSGKFIVGVKSAELFKDMVIDFNELGFVKHLIDDHCDHRMFIYQNDPILTALLVPSMSALRTEVVKQVELELVDDLSANGFNVYRVKFEDKDRQTESCFYQWLDGIYVTSFNTTSECLARWMYYLVKDKIDQYNKKYPDRPNVMMDQVSYKETPKSTCTFSED